MIVPLCFTFVPSLVDTLLVVPGKTILIVEDDGGLRKMLKTSLLLEGYDVKEAGDGFEALALIDRETPDLVVLDLMLPTVSGVIVRQEIAAQALTREIPIVVITGSALDTDGLDVECVLHKPIHMPAFVTAVRRCLTKGAPGIPS